MAQTYQGNETFKIIGRYMKGTELVGYQLVSSNGEQVKMSKKSVEDLINKGLIPECRLAKYEGKIYVRGVRASELPVMNINTGIIKDGKLEVIQTYRITHRIIQGGKVIGYQIQDNQGNVHNVTQDKAWQLASKKMLINAAAGFIGKTKVIKGTEIELRRLPYILQ